MKEKAIGRGHVKSFLDEFQLVADVSKKQKSWLRYLNISYLIISNLNITY